jgi:hypothetical protein
MNQHFNWLPTEVLEIMPGNTVELDLELAACECQGKWPTVEIWLGNNQVYNGPIIKSKIIKTRLELSETLTSLKIIMYGKTDKDTLVDNYGNIIQNQSLHLCKLLLNGVDVIKNKFVYKGIFKMLLSEQKTRFFEDNNIATEVTDYNFYENGTWTLLLQLPILTGIVKTVATTEMYEKIDYSDLMSDIIDKINTFTRKTQND